MSDALLEMKVRGLDKVTLAFGGGIQAKVRASLRRRIDGLALELQGVVREDWLTGPGPERLEVQTGHLRRSVNIRRIDEPLRVSAVVGTNVFYGVAWEKGHVKNWAGQVQAPRPFMEPGYMQLRAHIQSELRAAVDEAVRRGGLLGV